MDGLERFYFIQEHRHRETLGTVLSNRAEAENVSQRMEEARITFDWETEQKSEDWSTWWKRKVNMIFLLSLWHFFWIFTLATISIFWEPVHVAFSIFIASFALFAKVVICYVGRKIHTGKNVTRILILIDGLASAYMYNSFAFNMMWLKYDILIYLPAVVALSSILVYILILRIVGIKLTGIRFNGLKFLPIELSAASIILAQLPYLYIIDKKYDIAYHEYMIHILTGELMGYMLCSIMACYLIAKLNEATDKKFVQDGLSLHAAYILALASQSPPESLPTEIV